MWTSERGRLLSVQESAAEVGVVTLGGDPAGVSLGGERRWLSVYGPGGYAWRPMAGDKVLVLKTGAERELPCILGKVQEGGALSPGEVRLSSGDSMVRLVGGQLDLVGEIRVNGAELREYIEGIVADMLSGGSGGGTETG